MKFGQREGWEDWRLRKKKDEDNPVRGGASREKQEESREGNEFTVSAD